MQRRVGARRLAVQRIPQRHGGGVVVLGERVEQGVAALIKRVGPQASRDRPPLSCACPRQLNLSRPLVHIPEQNARRVRPRPQGQDDVLNGASVHTRRELRLKMGGGDAAALARLTKREDGEVGRWWDRAVQAFHKVGWVGRHPPVVDEQVLRVRPCLVHQRKCPKQPPVFVPLIAALGPLPAVAAASNRVRGADDAYGHALTCKQRTPQTAHVATHCAEGFKVTWLQCSDRTESASLGRIVACTQISRHDCWHQLECMRVCVPGTSL